MPARHAVISGQLADTPGGSIRQACANLGISRAWFYARPTAPAPDPEAVRLREAIERLTLAFPGYGYRRVTHALRREGWRINAKRVLRVMREEALLCQPQRRFVVTTDSAHGHPIYPHRLRGL